MKALLAGFHMLCRLSQYSKYFYEILGDSELFNPNFRSEASTRAVVRERFGLWRVYFPPVLIRTDRRLLV